MFLCVVLYSVCLHLYSSSGSSTPDQSDKSNQKKNKKFDQKPNRKEATSVEQKPVHDTPVRSKCIKL